MGAGGALPGGTGVVPGTGKQKCLSMSRTIMTITAVYIVNLNLGNQQCFHLETAWISFIFFSSSAIFPGLNCFWFCLAMYKHFSI